MSIGLIGTKIGMTREFMDSGQSVPVTVIKVEKGRVIILNLSKINQIISFYQLKQKVHFVCTLECQG